MKDFAFFFQVNCIIFRGGHNKKNKAEKKDWVFFFLKNLLEPQYNIQITYCRTVHLKPI